MHDGPRRKRLRYPGHDYRAPCCVHVTICTHHRQPLFGTITPAGLILNDAGRFVIEVIRGLHSEDEGILIDVYVVMPDHVHVVIMLTDAPGPVRHDLAIEHVVSRLKMRVMKAWSTGIRTRGWNPYEETLWQRSYNDVLIGTDRHLEQVRAYIEGNPARAIERMLSRKQST
ncbi:MAG TPA: transposase [Thermomicrobiales bacterium]|nr:transposase [Thermomicrobiales bacterium]